MSANHVTNSSQLRSLAGRIGIVAAMLGAMTLTVPAQAEEYHQATVKYEDLDLSKEGDVKRLYTRLQQASKDTCRDLQRRFGRLNTQRESYQQCYQQALDGAVSGINLVQLTKLHTSRESMTVAREGKARDAG